MPQPPANIVDEAGIAFGNLTDAVTGLMSPTLRLGVTGLSRAGKTIFITALIHNLLTGARMPGFGAMADGRLIGAQLSEQPDGTVPRFAYEQHLDALTGPEPHWPKSTSRISQIRLTLKFQSEQWLTGMLGPRQIHIDIVDYPGEWLLDLPLLSQSYQQWSAGAIERAKRSGAKADAKPFFDTLAKIDVGADLLETDAEAISDAFKAYLNASRKDGRALSTLPPGRFLMPGDMAGSPALTFAPLPQPDQTQKSSTLYAAMERRFEAYKNLIVRPFFRDHFARLDRQIVLVDTLRALNAGPEAVSDLETALTEVLGCFRTGSSNPFIQLIAKRIDRILFAATKADHLHHLSHDRLEEILSHLVANASRRAKFSGANTRTLALAAIRATHEDVIEEDGESLNVIIGTPERGEVLGDEKYDGKTEVALFPGDLPKDIGSLFKAGGKSADLNFLRFLPPAQRASMENGDAVLPNIRLDRALEFLIGDRLK